MKPPRPSSRKTPPRQRNLAAKALAQPAFRPKIVADPELYKRKPKFSRNPVDLPDDDKNN